MADENRNRSKQSSDQQGQQSSPSDELRRTQGLDDESSGSGESARERTSRDQSSTADDRAVRERRNMRSDERDPLTRDSEIETENVESDLDDIDEDSER